MNIVRIFRDLTASGSRPGDFPLLRRRDGYPIISGGKHMKTVVIAILLLIAATGALAQGTSIYDIQTGAVAEGTLVTPRGVVTGVTANGFFVAEAPYDAWRGIWVYAPGHTHGGGRRRAALRRLRRVLRPVGGRHRGRRALRLGPEDGHPARAGPQRGQRRGHLERGHRRRGLGKLHDHRAGRHGGHRGPQRLRRVVRRRPGRHRGHVRRLLVRHRPGGPGCSATTTPRAS